MYAWAASSFDGKYPRLFLTPRTVIVARHFRPFRLTPFTPLLESPLTVLLAQFW